MPWVSLSSERAVFIRSLFLLVRLTRRHRIQPLASLLFPVFSLGLKKVPLQGLQAGSLRGIHNFAFPLLKVFTNDHQIIKSRYQDMPLIVV